MMARMTGSGSACFAIFPFAEAAEHAARVIRAAEPRWWVTATICGGSD
jgi:4-diphosphocytidyl-2-C-methyl-D-erythritol kinase